MKYKCSVCGQEFTEKEAEQNIVKYDEATGYCECSTCAQKILTDYLKNKELNNIINFKNNDQEDYLKKVTDIKTQLSYFQNLILNISPQKIKQHLDDYVIGQEEAKKILSVAIYNHYKRITYLKMLESKKAQGIEINNNAITDLSKSNVIMVGYTGSGKSYLLETIAKFLDIPFAITDCSCLTESGFVGQDPETCVKNLWLAANKDITKTETGIIFLDEFDKLARKSGTNRSITADPGREGVQQALLKIIEGTTVSFQAEHGRRNPDAPGIYVNTKNILFIVGGAFEGIEKIINKRISKNRGIGLDSNDDIDIDNLDNEIDEYNALIDNLNIEDIKEYGMIPEILGRLPILCKLHQLNKGDLIHIMTQPKNAILKQMQVLFKMDGCNVNFDIKAINKIAEDAIKTNTGARALKTIIENVLLKTMYNLPNIYSENKNKGTPIIQITEEGIKKNNNFNIIYKNAQKEG